MVSRDIPARAALRDDIDRLITTTWPQYNNDYPTPIPELRHLETDIGYIE